jgi:hypothetical protein
MAKWRGETMYSQLAADASLKFFERMATQGEPLPSVVEGDDIEIQMGPPDDQIVTGELVDVAPDRMTLVVKGAKWKMTPWHSADAPTPTWDHGPSEDWVIRSAA